MTRRRPTTRVPSALEKLSTIQPVEFTGIAIFEVRNGKLAHNWVERSAYELMQRLQKGGK